MADALPPRGEQRSRTALREHRKQTALTRIVRKDGENAILGAPIAMTAGLGEEVRHVKERMMACL
jgi:hypothetical protein